MSANDIKRFEIVNGVVVAVYEYDDGRWEFDPIERDEHYSLQGTNVAKQEYDDGYLETTLYSPQGDGTYREVSKAEQPFLHPSSDDDSSLFPDTDDSFFGPQPVDEDLMRFEITNGIVTQALEFDDGRWKLESIEWDEIYTVNGTDVIKQEYDDGYLETTRYRDAGDGTYRAVEKSHTRPESDDIKPVSQDAELVRVYLSILDRTPDIEGYWYWDSRMDEGMTLQHLINHFIDSDEFQRDYGGADNTEFVTRLYENVLSRQPDEAGLAWWCEQLEDGSYERDDLVMGFVQSDEFITSSESTVQDFLLGAWSNTAQADLLIS
jgi:hypothetical protein